MITQLGQPVLRRRAHAVSKIKVRSLAPLIREMTTAMRKARGVGIAAPQMGKSLRLFIVASTPSRRYPHAPKMRPIAMINPRLLNHSNTTKTDWEGCLSIPGIRGKVPRFDRVNVVYLDIKGNTRKAVLTGFVARIFQHELDHINGRVFLDRVGDTRTLVTESEYRKWVARS